MTALALLALVALQERDPPAPADPAAKDQGYTVERIHVPRQKGLVLSVELRRVSPDPLTPMLVLYHRANSSKGEYRPIVQRLRELGYNCVAVDLSTGADCNEVHNLTARLLAERGRNPTFLDSLADIEESLTWVRGEYAHGKVIAWGSGFSAGLVLHEAALRPDLVDGVVSFSPADSFASVGKSATWIQESVRELRCPVFVASARSEVVEWQPIFAAIPGEAKTSFVPEGAGTSGTPALWPESKESEQYWAALTGFLQKHFPPAPPKGG